MLGRCHGLGSLFPGRIRPCRSTSSGLSRSRPDAEFSLQTRRDDIFDRCLSRELDGRFTQAEALGPQPNLSHRFLARDIDRPVTCACERGGGLNQQRGLSNPWVAADEKHRTANETAAGDTVEFIDPRYQARGIVSLSGQCLESKQATSAWFATRPGRPLGPFLAERIPLTAGLAFALPAAEGGAAVLANKGEAALGHRESPQNGRSQR